MIVLMTKAVSYCIQQPREARMVFRQLNSFSVTGNIQFEKRVFSGEACLHPTELHPSAMKIKWLIIPDYFHVWWDPELMVVYFQELVSTVWVLLEIYDINLDNLHLTLILNTDITRRASLAFKRPSTTQKVILSGPHLYIVITFVQNLHFFNTKKKKIARG